MDSFDETPWREMLRQRCRSMAKADGTARALTSIQAERAVTAADRKMEPAEKDAYLKELDAIATTLRG